jgi:hypothetical protein
MTNATAPQTLSPSDYRYQREVRRLALAVKLAKIQQTAAALVSA